MFAFQVLCELLELRVLYLHGNGLFILSEVDRLGVLPRLHTITLHGNMIETNKAYRWELCIQIYPRHTPRRRGQSEGLSRQYCLSSFALWVWEPRMLGNADEAHVTVHNAVCTATPVTTNAQRGCWLIVNSNELVPLESMLFIGSNWITLSCICVAPVMWRYGKFSTFSLNSIIGRMHKYVSLCI